MLLFIWVEFSQSWLKGTFYVDGSFRVFWFNEPVHRFHIVSEIFLNLLVNTVQVRVNLWLCLYSKCV